MHTHTPDRMKACLHTRSHSPDEEGGEAGVELERPLVAQRLHGAVDGPLVGHAAVRVGGHLLQARLDKVKRQGARTGKEAWG